MTGPRPVRLAVLGLHHETNTFSTRRATLAAYRATGIVTGDELVARHATAKSTVAGYLAGDPDDGAEILPLLYASVEPCGPVTEDAFDVIVAEMLAMLRRAGRVDGVLLALHGACVADNHPDADADIAAAVRAVVGPDVPVGTVMDMHANISPRLIGLVDVMVAYQTNPHVDPRDKGIVCRRLLLDVIRTGRRPTLALEQLPLAVAIVKQDTSTEPMASLLAAAREVQRSTGALDVSLLEGFPYADVPQMGMSVIAMHHEPHRARTAARQVAEIVWSRRDELQGGAASIPEALTMIAAHSGDKPLLVLDVGDNIGGGGGADATTLLAAALDGGLTDLVTTIYDPAAVASVTRCAPGDRVTVTVGGVSPEQEGSPVELTGRLVGRFVGTYEEPLIAHGGYRFFDGGEMIGVMTDDRVAVVITSKPVAAVTPVQLEVVGLDPASFRAIVAKGVNAPRAGYARACEGVLMVDTPGVTRNSIDTFTYHHRRRPMYPYEPDTAY